MKKIFLFSVALIGLTACRNDDDKSTQEASIVGTWQPVKHSIIDGKTNQVIEIREVDECEQKDRFEFTNDGKIFATIFEQNQQGVCEQVAIDKGTYKYDTATKKLLVSPEGEFSKTNEVIRLTANELELIVESSDTNNDGVADKYIDLLKRVK